ncbi:MAG: Rpn family recombination-promoting nuclease/putative transposase [Pirellula sp.]
MDAARSLLANHLLSQIAEHLKLDTLAHVDTSFIDHNVRGQFADRTSISRSIRGGNPESPNEDQRCLCSGFG